MTSVPGGQASEGARNDEDREARDGAERFKTAQPRQLGWNRLMDLGGPRVVGDEVAAATAAKTCQVTVRWQVISEMTTCHLCSTFVPNKDG